MKSRSLPAPSKDPRLPKGLQNDLQVRKWAKRIKGDTNARPQDLSEEQMRLVAGELLKRRGLSVSQTHFERALEATRPILTVPDLTDPAADLDLIFQLEEMKSFWRSWQRPNHRRGSRGPEGSDQAVKALMAGMAIPGLTTHAQTAHQLLSQVPAFQEVFARLEARIAADRGQEPESFQPLSYAGALTHRKEVAESCSLAAMRANVALVRSLRDLHGERVGEGLLLDGCLIPAWAPQTSSRGNPELEKTLRRYAKDAGFRAIHYSTNGKRDLAEVGDSELRGGITRGKAARGYYLMLIMDQATGLPLVWSLVDAARESETTAVVPVLSLLYQLYPDCPASWIAADSAFDNDPVARLLRRRLRAASDSPPPWACAGQRGPAGTGSRRSPARDERRRSAGLRRPPEAAPLRDLDRPSRAGLRPGQTAPEGAFRYRVRCEHDDSAAGGHGPCGRMSLPASFDWSKLTHYPHHGNGRPELYAFRQAILAARMGQIESCFQALKGGHLLGGSGASRTRIREKHVHEALISLAFLGRTALTVADQRIEWGLFSPERFSPPAQTPA